MLIFEQISPENTPITIRLAIEKATKLSTDIVLAATSGASAVTATELAAEADYKGRIVVVTHVWGMRSPGENKLLEDNRRKLVEAGVIIVTASQTLSGVERSMIGKFGGCYPVEVMAHTLRLFCQGVKVCVEIGTMALDAGVIREPKPIVTLGGSNEGLDTACVLTPGYSAKIFEARVHEILCKPY